MAAWYEQEAARLRSKAAEIEQMPIECVKPSYHLALKESRSKLIAYCQRFNALAKLHREQDKAIP